MIRIRVLAQSLKYGKNGEHSAPRRKLNGSVQSTCVLPLSDIGRLPEVIFRIQCLSKLPHDSALTPSVDPSESLIPPVNTSSSYYDGIISTIGFSFRGVGVLTAFFRYSVPPHGPEYSGRFKGILSMPFDLSVLFFRYIGPGYSFPGIAGTYISSKNHSRKSANIPACRHIGIGLSVIRSSFLRVYDSDDRADAPDFFESSFWKDSDPMSGLGGWGDPNDDYTVHDGGFHNLQLAYPVPHHVRRNFTLRPWDDTPFPLVTDPLKIGNISFSASVIEAILETPAGHFKEFQTVLETVQVRNWI
jgi:hypothetical protein